MMILVTYDIAAESIDGQQRLRNISKMCKDYGQRVQNSVFECMLTPAQLVELRDRINALIDDSRDSVRIYRLSNNWKTQVEHFGSKIPYDPEGMLIV